MSESKTMRDPKLLVSLLTQQRDMYLKLRELSEKQRSLISGDHPDQLLSILRERQTLVTSLAQLNERLAPFRRDWEGTYTQLPDDTKQEAQGLLQEINGLLRVILRTDQEDSALLSARKKIAGDDVRAAESGRVANVAYARQGGTQAPAHSADVQG